MNLLISKRFRLLHAAFQNIKLLGKPRHGNGLFLETVLSPIIISVPKDYCYIFALIFAVGRLRANKNML